MNKAIGIVIASVVFLIASNIYYYYDTYNWQLNIHQEVLTKEIRTCKENHQKFFKETKTNILLLLNEKELNALFEFNTIAENTIVQERTQLLYNRYGDVLKELTVSDTKGHCYTLSRMNNGVFVSKYSEQNRQEYFKETVNLNIKNNTIEYKQPLYADSYIYGYVSFSINAERFYKDLFHNFSIRGHQVEWILDHNNNVIFSTLEGLSLASKKKENLYASVLMGDTAIIHTMHYNGLREKVLTSFEVIKISGSPVILAFSLRVKPITDSILMNFAIIALITFVIIMLIVLFFLRVVSKNKVNAIRLNQSEEALQKVLHYLPVGVVMLDSNKRIKQVNRAALNLFDYEDEDLLLNSTVNYHVIFEKKKVVQHIDITKTSSKYVLDNGQGNQQILLNETVPFFLQDEQYTIEVFIESTPFEKIVEPSGKAHLAKTTFIANVSHELRTPLNGIIGMTDVMLLSNNLPDAERDMLGIVKRSSDTLLALINDILDFSKIESGKLEVEAIPMNLNKEIQHIIGDFEVQVKERNLKLSWESDGDIPEDYLGDPLRIKQVLINIIGNAIKFTAHGEVRLKVEKVKALNGNSVLKFTVSDTGIGINKDKLQTIFQSFSQEDESTTRKFGGTGLGTSISKNLVQLMGGEIWAVSPSSISTNEEYPGSDFCFTLPLLSMRKRKNLDFSYIFAWTQINVLVISDDLLQVQAIAKNMMALGIKYTIMSPSQETIVSLRDTKKYHAIIVDQRPDFNGIDFLQELYNYNLHTQYLIVLQSSDYQKMNTNIGKRLGADIYLRKPIKIDILKSFLLRYFTSIRDTSSMVGKVVPHDLKILVAEDNLFNQKVASNLFSKLGYTIDIANNGNDVIKMFTECSYDIIFMDLQMPELNGFEATVEVKKLNSTCPIIAMTANNDSSIKDEAFNVGVDDFIVKPAQREEINRMILKWCAK